MNVAAPGLRCTAVDEWFDLLCGAPATRVADNGVKEGPVCAADAARAVLAGWRVRELARD